MRQAADILASHAAMQIRQLEALQQMAKSANSKVVFVPMQLQSDVGSQLSGAAGSSSNFGAMLQNKSTNDGTVGVASRVGVLNSVAKV